MIVEYSMPGFQVEPSQGTHFFQNITSLGVGYLSIDTVAGDGNVDFDALGGLDSEQAMKYAVVLHTEEPITAYIERNTNRALAGIRKNADLQH